MKKRNQFSKVQSKLLNESIMKLLGKSVNEKDRPLESALIISALSLNKNENIVMRKPVVAKKLKPDS